MRLSDFSWKNWKHILDEFMHVMGDKNIGILSAGIAYFGVLAFFPMVVVVVAFASLVVSPEQVAQAGVVAQPIIPSDIHALFVTQLSNAVGNTSGNIVAIMLGLALAIFGMSSATANLMSALNVMYGLKESRHFVRQRFISIVMTLGLMLAALVLVPLILSGNDFLQWLGVPVFVAELFAALRWILLAGLMIVSLAVVYHYGPNHHTRQRWQWLSWGAIIATWLWLIASGVFFMYLQYVADFSNSYSLFAGLIALMIWLNITSFVVLMGAEINYRLERREASA
jgi:membrane protein